MHGKPSVLILRTAGTNCDEEAAHAFELAGATTQRVHLNRVIENPALLAEHQILAIPGGFSYGDDIAAGRIFANQIKHHLHDAMHDFVAAGKPIIGVCNGFQVLVQTDLLPGALPGIERSGQLCTLTNNESGGFVDRWITVSNRSRRCIWTQDLPERVEMPIAHGEGRFVPADEQVRAQLWADDRVALVYVKRDDSPAESDAFNPNGSVDDIAGICDASGLVLGLMPHPERHVDLLQHPAWTSVNRAATRRESTSMEAPGMEAPGTEAPGLRIFQNAVQHVVNGVGSGV